jgi:hypothetical protein
VHKKAQTGWCALEGWVDCPGCLPGFVAEELAAHLDFHAVALGIFNAVDGHGEIDGAHDAGAKLFFDEGLQRGTVNVDDFLEAVLERFLGDGGGGFTLVGKFGERDGDIGAEVEGGGDSRSGIGGEGIFTETGGGGVNFGEAGRRGRKPGRARPR